MSHVVLCALLPEQDMSELRKKGGAGGSGWGHGD